MRHEIAERAYYLWEESGRPEGRALEHWLEAEAALREQWGNAGVEEKGSEVQERERAARAARYGLVLRSRSIKGL